MTALDFYRLLTQLGVLEHSEIAWPNHRMWLSVPGPRYMTAPAPFESSKGYNDHGHSPSRTRPDHLVTLAASINPSSQTSSNTATFSGSSLSAYNAWAPYGGFSVPATQWSNCIYTQEPRWEPQNPYRMDAGMEFFVDDTVWRQRGARASREDVPMPDYVSMTSSSSRPLSSLTGFSFEHSNQPSITACLDEDQYNELIQSLTPTKAAPIGTRAPSNTPSAVMLPPSISAAVTARSAAYTRSRRASQRSSRAVSGFSLMSLTSDKDGKKDSEKDGNKVSERVLRKNGSKEVLMESQTERQKEGQKEIQEEVPKEAQQDPLEETQKEIQKGV
jgi:hypothetical protein